MILKNVGGGHALRIAIGIMALVLVLAGGAGATKFIRNDATGGDCTSFGTWNAATKTCTMTSDLIETIQIDSNGTTLDGNGYQTAGSGADYGVNLTGRSGVTIKNLNVGQFQYGFYLLNSNNNYLISNRVSSNTYGIYLSGSSSNKLSGNNANTNSNTGFYLSSFSSNALSGNNANSNYYGIYLFYSDNNTLDGNNANSNTYQGIVLSNSKINNLTGNNANLNKNYDGIYLSSSSSNKLSGNIANSNNGNGIHVSYSNSNRLNSNNANLNKGNGIHLYPYSSSNTLNGNIASSNNAGILVYYYSNSNTLSGNNASNNKYGIDLEADSNTVSGNIASSNSVNGISLSGSNNNIYNNYFNNTNNLVIKAGSNTWNVAKISGTNIIGGPYLGGNFWAYPNGTGFSQKCADADKDGICDAQYTLDSNNVDYLPLAKNTATRVTVISPNGGENWQVGTIQTIKWTYTGNPGSFVKIELLKGGVTNRVINSSTSAGSSGSGSYNWLINSTQPMGTNYKIRVTSTTNSAYTDTSNNNFTITVPGITVVSPNGGETWARGLTQTIKWTYLGNPGSSVKIELMKAGVLNRVINSSISKGSNGSGSYNWLINSTQTLGSDYKVRITSTTNSAYTDTSNNNFTISVPIRCNTSTIYGYSFNDTNGNKTKDSGEVGLSNRTINLKGYDTCTRTLVSKIIKSNTTGYFAFKSINPGSYVLSEDYILGWLPTTDAAYTLSIPSVSVTIRKDFGNKKFI